MQLRILEDAASIACAAAEQAASTIQKTIAEHGRCRLVLATGNSQIEFLNALTRMAVVDWAKVEAFHLDEYVGLAMTHPASFRKFLLERVIRKTGIQTFHVIEGDSDDLSAAIRAISTRLTAARIDLAFVGIGENGHIAFNDPPADFATEEPYIIVDLDEACRRQQVGEGWFAALLEVPMRAISMSPQQILKAKEIIAVVPDLRKAQAVKLCLEGEIGPTAPASILRRHPNATIYLDRESASLLTKS
ncbi:MAG TPA: glucosamine-6-phosphate deaminase [Candidatus Sulfotelmatobacter sp.]|nr:glucosamine-6-phosphate deaminase [Candidatus Sulfotelmatobacter sp.]